MNDNKHYFDKDGHLVTDAIIAYIRDDLKNDKKNILSAPN
jgi:hypothetical protein